MQAADLETLCQSLQLEDGQEGLYLLGSTLKALGGKKEREGLTDDCGQPIVDDELYCITTRGIFLVE